MLKYSTHSSEKALCLISMCIQHVFTNQWRFGRSVLTPIATQVYAYIIGCLHRITHAASLQPTSIKFLSPPSWAISQICPSSLHLRIILTCEYKNLDILHMHQTSCTLPSYYLWISWILLQLCSIMWLPAISTFHMLVTFVTGGHGLNV